MIDIQIAQKEDLPKIHSLQMKAFESVAKNLNWPDMPNITETLEEAFSVFDRFTTLKMTLEDGTIIGSIRGNVSEDSLYIGHLMVHPEFQGHGYGYRLIKEIESLLPHKRAWLNTCEQLEGNVHIYEKAGYKPFKYERINDHLTRVFLEKTDR